MKNKNIILKDITLILMCIFMIAGITPAKTVQASTLSNIKVHYIDVGQGDSELLQINGKNILIDAGNKDNKVYNYLKSLKITKLDYVIATHPHEDHIGGMAKIINNFKIGKFYAPKVTTNTNTYKNMILALKKKKLKITVPTVNSKITIGKAILSFLGPKSSKYKDLNNYSIVTKLKYGSKSFLFMGDAEGVSEKQILSKKLNVKADVLKVGHHGSSSSTSQGFLNRVSPKYAVISVGKGNKYGHPTKTTLNKLNNKKIKTYRTDSNGTIIANCNGSNISFTTKKVTAAANRVQNVYLANSRSKIYHYSKKCSNMKGPVLIKFSSAKAKGLKPCKKCVH